MDTTTTSPPAISPSSDGHDTTRETVTIAISVVSTAFALIFVLVRLYSSILIARAMKYDDYACGLAVLGSIAYATLTIMTNVQDESQDIDKLMSKLSKGYIQQVLLQVILYEASICLTQVSLFLLFLRLFASNQRFRYMVYSGITLSVVLFISAIMVMSIACSPMPGQPWGSNGSLPHLLKCSITQQSFDVASGVVGVILDFYLLYLPLPVLCRLHLQRKKKLRIIALFMTGLLACIAAIVSLILGIKLHLATNIAWDADVVDGLVPSVNMLELNIAIICGSVPAFACFLKHIKRAKSNKYCNIRVSSSRPTNSNGMTMMPRHETSGYPPADNPFLESHLLETHITAENGTLESSWSEDAIPIGTIVQSFHVEISSSINGDGGDEMPALHESALNPPSYPRAVHRDGSKE